MAEQRAPTKKKPGRKRPAGKRAARPRFEDVALVMGPTEDRAGYHILRKRADAELPELGTVRPLREGKPIDGEIIALRQRKDVPMLFDVKSELDPHPERRTGVGPPLVASDEYRRGWDAIWGRKPRDVDSQAN